MDRLLNEEIQWGVQRWFLLLVFLVIPVLGYFLEGFFGEDFAFACYVISPLGVIHILSRWRGSAANQLVMELAKRVDDHKEG